MDDTMNSAETEHSALYLYEQLKKNMEVMWYETS